MVRLLARYGTAVTGGVLVALSFPPRGWWYLAPVGIGLLSVGLVGAGWARRLAVGWLAGVALFGTVMGLIWEPSAPIVVLLAEVVAALILAVIVAVAGVLTPPRGVLVGLPAAFVVVAAVQARFPFGGLPGVGIAFGQVDGPLVGVAPLGGELTVVAVTALAGTSLVALAARRVRSAGVALAVAAGLVLAGALPSWTGPAGTLTVAAVQAGGSRGVGVRGEGRVLDRHIEVAQRLDQPVDVVVLPENIVHVDDDFATTEQARRLSRLADRLDAVLVAGVIERVGDDAFRNAAVVWDGDGRRIGRYDKVHPVPFAEYVPGRSWLEDVVDLSLVPRDAIPGDQPGVVVTPVATLGIVVSFELFFPRLVRAVVAGGADLIVAPTNAASFTGDEVPAYEVAATRLRARANERPAVQVAPTGYSALIAADGTVIDRSQLGRWAGVLVAALTLREGTTPFTRWGNLPAVLAAVLALAGAWWWSQRRPG